MNKIRFTLKAFAFLALMFAFATAAQAQATRTWVSGVGDDVNPCSRTAPCKTYAGAISKTAAGGEISTLDPGGFGAVTTTKSILIEGTKGQGYGSILATPVINQPQIAILSTDGVKKRPVVIEQPDGSDAIAVRPTGLLALAWDHRAVDGDRHAPAGSLVPVADDLVQPGAGGHLAPLAVDEDQHRRSSSR